MNTAFESLGTPTLAGPMPWQVPLRPDPPFNMHSHPPSVWPDFLVGKKAQPLRLLLVDDDPRVSRVSTQALLRDKRIHLAGQAG